MGKICLQCGDKGSANAFVYCVICLKFAVHRYCLDVIPKTMDEFVPWVCGDDCEGLAQKLSIERDRIRDCVISNKVKGTRNKVVLTNFHKDGPKILHDACTESDPDNNSNEHVPMLEGAKNNADLPILSPEEENIYPPEAKKKKGKVSGRKRLLNGGPEKTKKKKTVVKIQEVVKNNADLPNLSPKEEENMYPLEAKKKKGKVSGRKRLSNGGPEKMKKNKTTEIIQEDVKNNADLPILLPEEEENKFPLEAKKKKGKVSGRKRLLNGGPEKTKKKKTKVIIQSSMRNDERGLENIVPPKKDSEEGVIRSSKKKNKKKTNKKKKKAAITSKKEIIVSCEDNDNSPSQVQVGNNLELEVYNNDPSGGFQKYLHAEPVAMPIWRGSFDIWNGKDYILNGLLAHLSILACQKVFDEACQFQPVLRFEMLPKSDVWPKSFETMKPSGDSIALYFFPSKSSERDFDRLVEEMKQKELALKAVVQNAELLVFDSSELPLLYWKFQGKYYLWGVFRQKQSTPSNSYLKTNDKNPIKQAEKTSTGLKGCNVLSPKSPLSISASNGSDA